MYRNWILAGFRALLVAGLFALTGSFSLASTASGQPSYYMEDYLGSPQTRPGQKSPARIRVRLPAHAELHFNDYKTTSTGPVREFETPELEPDQVYSYLLLARWEENGIAIEKRREVRALSGKLVTVNFVPVAQEPPQPPQPSQRPRPPVVRVTPPNVTPQLPPLAPPTNDWLAPFYSVPLVRPGR